ncbi:hypothetical protein [Mycobacterium sp.]|uniref:hypothetical protein n=1 Tax=Mycobacterium sp. TaxID=1785 RepID=UPI00344C9B61
MAALFGSQAQSYQALGAKAAAFQAIRAGLARVRVRVCPQQGGRRHHCKTCWE